MTQETFMDAVRIFDTTLRDGEQSPGFSMNAEEKIRMARQLAAHRVDVIEAGFPIASKGDLEGVQRVARESRDVPIAALARAKKHDVDAAIEALQPAAEARLHVFLATSDLHLRVKLGMTREQALEAIGAMIRYGRQHVAEVEFSAEDAGRTDIDFLCTVCRTAVEAGATVLNLPDTVGYAVPEEYGEMFRRVREYLDDAPGVTLSAHCHDDLGLAVANSLAAVRAGVRQIECTVNGIGERAGNVYYGRGGGVGLGGGGRERVCARSGHSSGRDHQESADVRDHFAGNGWRALAVAGAGKAFGQERAESEPAGPGLRTQRRGAGRSVRASDGAGRSGQAGAAARSDGHRSRSDPPEARGGCGRGFIARLVRIQDAHGVRSAAKLLSRTDDGARDWDHEEEHRVVAGRRDRAGGDTRGGGGAARMRSRIQPSIRVSGIAGGRGGD